MLRDLRYAWRNLLRTPIFTVVAVVTLALGIGANTAIFSVIESVLLHSLPFKNAARVFQIERKYPGFDNPSSALSIPDYLDIQRQDHAFSRIAITNYGTDLILSGAGEPRHLTGFEAPPDLLPMLGFGPVLGRNFNQSEATPGHNHVAILSNQFWLNEFGGDRGVLGRTLRLNNASYTIIGVLPPRFLLSRRADVLIPFVLDEATFKTDRSLHNSQVFGELAPGVSLARASADTHTIAARLRQQYPDVDKDQDYVLVSLRDRIAGQLRPALLLLMLAVGVVLIIACANMSNMLLARSAGRRRELAVRTALGASRARVIRQLLIESLLLSCIGAAIGLLFASAIVRALIAIAPTNLPESTPIGLNLPVLLFTTVLAVITAVLFGLAPAIHTTRSDVSGALKERSSTGGRESSHTRSALIIVETALALVLSVGAGLLLKSFIHLTDQDPGFATHGVLTMGLSFDPAQSKLPQMTLLMREIGDRLRALPGIEAAGGTSALPMDYGGDLIFTIEGKPAPTDLATAPDGLFRFVTPGYLQALGLKLQQGRWMAETDQATSQPVVIINRALATKYFPGQNALGQHLSLGAPFVPALRDIGQREIIGIVGDARTVSLHEPDRPTFYMPVSQMPLAFEQPLIAGGFNLAVRTAGDPLAQKTAILSSIHSVAPAVPISDVRTIQDLLGDDLSPQRFNFLLLLSFAGIGVLLAAVGIYGVMAYSVTQRRAEVGVRVAFGADRSDIIRLIVTQGMRLAVVGLVIGIVAALLLGRWVQSFIYGVSASDSATFAAVGILFAVIALIATLIPSLRALRVDPVQVLRSE